LRLTIRHIFSFLLGVVLSTPYHSVVAQGDSSSAPKSTNKAVANPTALDSVKANPNGNWLERVKFLMIDNKNKDALSILRKNGESIVEQHKRERDSLRNVISQSNKTAVEAPKPVEEPQKSQEEEVAEDPEPAPTESSSSSNGSSSTVWLVLVGLLAASGAGLVLYDFRKITLVQKLSEQARIHVRKLNEKIALQPQLEKSAADLVQDIDQIMPLTSQESKLFSHIVNDKNHPFIKSAKEIISGTQILKRMVSDLPKSTAGNLKKTNVNRLIEEVSVQAYYSMRDHYPDFSCEMRRDLEKILPDTELNADEIRFVLFNILENAFDSVWRKKSGSGKGYQPSVTITSRKLPRYIQVRVKDNGTGIPDNIRKDIFEPFFTDREGSRHIGLGLHESYDIIVNKYKGDLILENDFQSSTDFIIRLPLKA
jgi:hypothetical protein